MADLPCERCKRDKCPSRCKVYADYVRAIQRETRKRGMK